jgi:hypothetical protein
MYAKQIYGLTTAPLTAKLVYFRTTIISYNINGAVHIAGKGFQNWNEITKQKANRPNFFSYTNIFVGKSRKIFWEENISCEVETRNPRKFFIRKASTHF